MILALRVLAVRLSVTIAIMLLPACVSSGTINWTVTQTIPTPAATPAGVDYVPTCLPTDPPGSYCQP